MPVINRDSIEMAENVNQSTAAEIYASAVDQALAYTAYDQVLRNEGNPTSAKYGDIRKTYTSEWLKTTDKHWNEFNGHEHGLVYVSPELKYLWPLIKKETDVDRASQIIRDYYKAHVVDAKPNVKPDAKVVTRVDTRKVPSGVWFSTTLKGVNLRPGIMANKEMNGHDIDKMEPLHLDDMNPHGLIAGRTGAGKSVALNTMIASLMTEFAPWELDINLADFKIVEMSRYGQTGFEAPHVSKIAATEAMEYVVSVMYDMYDSMATRQLFFAAVGVQNIKDFRNKFGVCLPHVVLLVDEFQQMYELASGKQETIINALIKMVTKLGRATGYHLLFASQSMSGTLSGDVQSNFKMRICLPASSDVSTAVLGNKASSELRGKGYCYTNCEGGADEYNIGYRVPFLNAEDTDASGLTPLQQILKWNKELADEIGYARPQNFFRDSAIRPLHRSEANIRTFEDDIEMFRQSIHTIVDANKDVEDIFLLGDSYVYKEPKGRNQDVTLEYFKLKIGDRKNIVCIGDSPYDRAYMTELLAMQYAQRAEHNQNIVCNVDTMMSDIYNVEKTLTAYGSEPSIQILAKELIETMNSKFETRKIIDEFAIYCAQIEERRKQGQVVDEVSRDRKLLDLIIQIKFPGDASAGFCDKDPDDFASGSGVSMAHFADRYYKYIVMGNMPEPYTNLTKAEKDSLEERIEKDKIDEVNINKPYEQYEAEEIQSKNNIRNGCIETLQWLFNAVKDMYISGIKDGKFSFKNMPTQTFWVLGFNNVTDLSGERNQSGKVTAMMRSCVNYGIRCIFVGSAIKDISEISRNFGYVLIKSANEVNYDRYDMTMAKEFKDNVLRFKAVGEVVNDVKQHLYPVAPDEKLIKMFDTDYAAAQEENFFDNFM